MIGVVAMLAGVTRTGEPTRLFSPQELSGPDCTEARDGEDDKEDDKYRYERHDLSPFAASALFSELPPSPRQTSIASPVMAQNITT
jgi:hypothetical protein